MDKNSFKKEKIVSPEVEKKLEKKIYFSFKYFDYKNVSKESINNNQNYWRKTILKMKELTKFTALEAITNYHIRVEESSKTKEIAKQIISDQTVFKKCDEKVYDLFRGKTSLRVFGILDCRRACFYLLMFDPIHKTR